MIGIVVAVLAAVSGAVVVFLITPPDRRRGLGGLLGIALLAFGSGTTAPEIVRVAAQFGAAAVMVGGAVTSGRPRLRDARWVLVVLLSFVVVVLTTTLIAYPLATIGFLRLAVVALAAAYCFAGFSRADLQLFLTGFLGLAAVEVALGLLEFFVTHRPIPWGYRVRADGSSSVLRNPLFPGSFTRVSGSLGHPIVYATVIATALLVVAARWGRHGFAVRWLFVPLLGVALVLSGSRSVLVGLTLAVVVLVWNVPGRGRALRVFLLGSVTVVVAVVAGGTLLAAAQRLVGSGSYTNRAGAIDAVPGLLARSPLESLFGSGFGSDFELYRRGFFEQNGFMVIDNQLVTTLGTGGIIGVLLVVLLFVAGWFRGGRLRRALLALFAVMLFSFDYLGWPAMFALLVVALVVPEPADDSTAA